MATPWATPVSAPRSRSRSRLLLIVVLPVVFLVGLQTVGSCRIEGKEPYSLDDVADTVPGRLVEVGGRRVHIVERGSSGPVVVLIHGFGGNTYDWEEHIVTPLSQGHRVVAVDLFGLGYSERGQLDYGFELWSSQIVGVLDALDIRRATIVGHSMGGAVGALFAAEHADRTERLVLVSALGPTSVSETPWWFLLFAAPATGEAMMGQVDYLPMLPGFSEEHYERARRVYRISGTRRALLHYVRRLDKFDRLAAGYGRIEAPVLLVHGTEDAIVPYASMERTHRALANGRIEAIAGKGHWLMRDAGQQLTAAIKRFVAE